MHPPPIPQIGVTEFCVGGALSLAAAVLCPSISAAAPFYGIPKPDATGLTDLDLTKIKVPVQGHFAELDHVVGFSTPVEYNALRDKMAAAGAPFEMFTYHAGHGFTSPENPNYDKEATTLALGRVYEFMAKNLA